MYMDMKTEFATLDHTNQSILLFLLVIMNVNRDTHMSFW